jgi:NADH-quinone oxidoreductase subunit F
MDNCKKCGMCKKACPVDAITWEKGQLAVIDLDKCTRCTTCYDACPFMAIE